MWKEMGKWLPEDIPLPYGEITRLRRYYQVLLSGRIFDLHRNGIYAILSEGKDKITRRIASHIPESRSLFHVITPTTCGRKQ